MVPADPLPGQPGRAGGVLQGCLLIMSKPDRSALEGSATISSGSCRVSDLCLLPLLPCQGRSKEEGRWGEDFLQWGSRSERGRSLQGDSLGIAGREHPRCQPSPPAPCSDQEGIRLALQQWGQDRAAKPWHALLTQERSPTGCPAAVCRQGSGVAREEPAFPSLLPAVSPERKECRI